MRSFQTIRVAPLTVMLVWIACAIFVGTHFIHVDREISLDEARRVWGAAVPLTKKIRPAGETEFHPIEGLTGPFDVWNPDNPQWWRYFFNSLHHSDLMHLVFNGWVLLIFGRVIERRMNWWTYMTFLVLGCLIPLLPDALTGNYVIGLSGLAYAMVGMLLVWRDQDPGVAAECPRGLLVFAGAWLLMGQVLTYLGVVPIANQGHFTGLIYGWMWGQAYCSAKEHPLPRFLFAVGHLLVIPAIWFVIHPFWSGAWHWYLATEQGVHPRRKLERLQTAVLRDPSLAHCWKHLTAEFLNHGGNVSAFRAALHGLKANPSHVELRDLVVEFWLEFETAENGQQLVEKTVTEVFGDESELWLKSLRSKVDPLIVRRSWTVQELGRLFDPEEVLTADLPQIETDDSSDDLPPVDPNAPDSAR